VQKRIDDFNLELEMLKAIIFHLLEDDSRKLHTFGNRVLLEASFRSRDNKTYDFVLKFDNDDLIVTSLRNYDPLQQAIFNTKFK